MKNKSTGLSSIIAWRWKARIRFSTEQRNHPTNLDGISSKQTTFNEGVEDSWIAESLSDIFSSRLSIRSR